MGLLDDAIRQHLELKRQHGAPEEEIERQEEEALGPARRDVAPAEPSGGDGEVELESTGEPAAADAASEQETALFEPEDREPAPEQPEAALDEPEAALGEPESALHEPEPAPSGEPDTPFEPEPAPSAGSDLPFEPGEEPEPKPEGVPQPDAVPPSPAPFDADTAFEEFSERGAPDDEDEEPEGGSEQTRDESDVLEDTPDFLQETPEHDRLWFEQKPPRDFDFD